MWEAEKVAGSKIVRLSLVDRVEGRLPADEAGALEERLTEADGATGSDLEWLRAFRRASEGTVIGPMPAGVREELVRCFGAYAEGVRPLGLLRRLTATLAPDGGAQLAFGVRSARAREETAESQLVYTTEAADVALSVSPRIGGLFDLDGQVFPNDAGAEIPPFAVQLLDAEGGIEVGLTVTDDLGEFSFESVAPGVYELLVSSDEVEIPILSVQLRSWTI